MGRGAWGSSAGGTTWASSGVSGTMSCALPAYWQCAPGANLQLSNSNLTSIPRGKSISSRPVKEVDWRSGGRGGRRRRRAAAANGGRQLGSSNHSRVLPGQMGSRNHCRELPEDQGYESGDEVDDEGDGGGGEFGLEGDEQPAAELVGTMSCALPAYRQCAQGANDLSSISNLTPIPRDKLTSSRMEEAKVRRQRRRKRHRGKKKSMQTSVDLKLLHINPRGWVSKRAAILDVINSVQPDYVNVNETQLRGENKVHIKGYNCFSKNRKDMAGGGICSAVVGSLKEQTVRVVEGGEEDEWQAVRLNHIRPAITIINVYGEQEGRSSKDEVRAKWGRLLKVLEEARLRGDHCLLVGDMNKQVGNDHLGVPGNHPEVTPGGQLIRDLVESGNWVLVNAMEEKVEGGPFTRQDPASGRQSCLDLWLCTDGLVPHVKSLVIDSERKMTVARPVWRRGRWQLTHSDHYTMLLTLQNLPTGRQSEKGNKEVGWNLARKNGWEKYKQLTEAKSESIKKVVENEELDIEEVVEKFERIENKIKFEAFGKTSRKVKVIKIDVPKKDGKNAEKARELIDKQSKMIEEEVEKIRKSTKGKVGQIYKIAKELKGAVPNQANAIKDPETKKLVVEQSEIKKVSLKYCKKVLEKNEPKGGMKKMFEVREKLNEERLSEKDGEGFEATKEVFDEVLAKFKANNKRSHDFLMKASDDFKDSVFLLCKRIIESESVPKKFRESTLHQIWKRKPGTRKEDLEANRYIHCKEWLPRTVEAMVVKEMESVIKKATSRFQIGGVAGHRPQEHIFSVKSVIGKYIYEKKMIILVCYDISGFFDKEVLGDVMDELHSIGVNPRAQRLFYKLNEATRVKVRTGCGDSEWGEVGDILGQGSGGAAKVSALNLSRKLDRVFDGSTEMARYGGVKQHPYSFQDDVLIPVESVEDLSAVNVKMTEVMNMMQTELNKTKSGYILMGTKEQKEKVRERTKEEPVRCGDFEMKELKEEKWLGDYFAGGLKESVRMTIKKREAKIRRASFEIINIVKDYRAQRIGGFMTGLVLWETCAIPSLIYNCSTWVGIGKEEIKLLNSMQDYFLRLLWGTGPGAPKVALRADTGTRSMESRIWREKIMLIYHVSHLEDGDLAKEMMEEQVSNNWPGLVKEVDELCKMLQLEDPKVTQDGKKAYNEMVKKACRWKDEALMKEEMSKMKEKKMRTMFYEDLEMKEYVKSGTLYSARKTWEVRSYMMDVAGNYPGHKKYKATMWRCQACDLEVKENQEHLTVCEGYEDLRGDADLGNEKELVEFFNRVMGRRKEKEWN